MRSASPLSSAPNGTGRITDDRAGMAAAIAAAITYGAAYPATAVALRSFSPLAIAGLACTLALVSVIALAAAGVLPAPGLGNMTWARFWRLASLSLLGGILFIVGVNIAVSITGPTITGFVSPLFAVMATLLAVPILGERVRPTTIIAFGFAFAGTALLAGAVPTGAPPIGILLALLSAGLFGLYMVLARRWGTAYRLDGTLITIANLVGRGPVLLVAAILIDPARVFPAAPDLGAVIALLTIAFGSSTSGNLFLMAAVRRISAGRASVALLVTPVASALIAAVVLGERLSAAGIVGAGLILAGMALASGVLAWRRGPVTLG